MDTIALITQKGGSGKTTLTLSLAVAAVLEGRTTLVIDLDTQGTACSWHDRRKTGGKGDSPMVIDAQPHRLSETLKQARANGVEFVLIDTPPRAADAALIAAKAADLVIVPRGRRCMTWKQYPSPAKSSPSPATNRRWLFSIQCRPWATGIHSRGKR
jgi:chromosome partitioning protein